MYPCHLANTLININNIPKMNIYYLANALINTNDKANDLISKMGSYVQSTILFLSLGNTER